ncbi:MAG: nuclear transport factor 2 family protein [Myxococcota bacterium]|nr:nuclear transport factor 2 family protein [Myxococcota bacterium]
MAGSDRTSAEWLRTEAAIREVETAYDAAWRAGDLDGLLACLSPDAVLINPYGELAEGHVEIRDELAKVLGASATSQEHTSIISRVSLRCSIVREPGARALLQPIAVGIALRARPHPVCAALLAAIAPPSPLGSLGDTSATITEWRSLLDGVRRSRTSRCSASAGSRSS